MHPLSFPRVAKRFASAAILTCCAGALGFAPSSAMAQAVGTVTELAPFTTATGDSPLDGISLKASDGNYYGTTASGGAFNQGTVYRFTPPNQITVIHNFKQQGGIANPIQEGSSPKAIIQAADGNLYGICRGGGTNPNTPGGGGTFFKLSLDGSVFEKLLDFDNAPEVEPGQTDYTGKFPSGIVQGNDGNFYGVTRDGGAPGNQGTYFRISPDGHTRTQLFIFASGNGPGVSPEAQLLKASDGNFYGLTTYGGQTGGNPGSGTIYVAKTDGTVTVLHLFGDTYAARGFFAPLIQGTDGALYGVGKYNGDGSHSFGAVFRCALDGTYSQLHVFTEAEEDGIEPSGLVQGSDGNFYGGTNRGFALDPADLRLGPGSYFQVTPSGTFTTLIKLTQDQRTPELPLGNLVEISPKVFVGVTQAGSGDNASLVSLTVTGETNSHPAFFTGEVALASGVNYLQFPSGNPFGYYSYLSDPHYIFHFDLGYEYVFDANDGNAGVYLYDFKSNGFFYTSPAFPFPYLYDFSLNTVLYYFPDPDNAGHYNTNGVRYFARLDTGEIFSK